MPYPNYHAARVRNPDDFEPGSFRTIALPKSKGGKGGVLMIIGKLKGEDTTTAQSYRFPKDLYTVAEAKQWLKDHDIKYISFEPAKESQSSREVDMPAITVHHTATIQGAWDGPQAKKNLKNDADEAYYRKAFAWQDPDADPKTKIAYKFIHHEVDEAGAIGAANVDECRRSIGVLNGGRSGTTIPKEDRPGVYDHVAAHIRDAGLLPEELHSADANLDIERRFLENEVRAAGAGEAPMISGMAAVYNREAVIGNLFREIISPGAFQRVLSENPDVVGAPNHNWDVVLGRTIAGTLKLEDRENIGLHYDIAVNQNDQEAMNFYSRVQRGDIRHSSFAFSVRKDLWVNPENPKDLPLRRVLEIDKLIDVSPVTFPAYPTASASARSKVEIIQQEMEQASQAASGGAEDEQINARRKARARRLQMLERIFTTKVTK